MSATPGLLDGMTHQAAQAEARRRWGASGAIEYRGGKPFGERYVVGTKGGGPNGIAYGKGASYAEAFENADARAQDERTDGCSICEGRGVIDLGYGERTKCKGCEVSP